MSKVKRKTQSQHLSDARAAKGKDFSPTWDGCDEWDGGDGWDGCDG